MNIGTVTDNQLTDADISKIWDYWYPLIFGFFYRRLNTHEDVEELTATTITALIMNPHVENAKAYIWQTARQQLYKFIENKSKKVETYEINEQTMSHPNAIDYYDAYHHSTASDHDEYSDHYTAKVAQLMNCVKDQLSESDYELVKSAIVDEKNSTEIGEMLKCKPGTVRQRLKRAIEKLRRECVELWIPLNTNKSTQSN